MPDPTTGRVGPRLLRERLLDRQRELGFRDGQMATALGIPRTTYSSIKTDRYGISLAIARKIAQAFPDLAAVVAAYALDEEPGARSGLGAGR